jgi:ATP-dependent exoDNAse (exonuclease V) alpha subunit
MKVTFFLDDAIYEQIKKQAADKTAEGVRKELKNRIIRFADVAPRDRAIVVTGAARQELEKVFQTTVNDSMDLLRKVKSLCYFKIGTVERCFTAGELARLQEQAIFHGWNAEQWLEMTSNEAIDYLFGKL